MNDRSWVRQTVRRIEADFNRSADTHLIPLALPAYPGVPVYLKDESSHPAGSLKHRLARSLFLDSLCNGRLHEKSTVIESSSGSTAVSEAYFARLLGLRGEGKGAGLGAGGDLRPFVIRLQRTVTLTPSPSPKGEGSRNLPSPLGEGSGMRVALVSHEVLS